MNINSPLLSIVIVSFNTREHIAEGLQAVFNDPPSFPFEVIMVDNASTDGTVEMIRSQFPKVQLIINKHNRYFSPANNQGLQASRGKYILILNSDVVVNCKALESLINFLETHPQAGAVGPVIRHPSRRNGGYTRTSYWPQVTLFSIVRRLQPISFFDFKSRKTKVSTLLRDNSVIEVDALSDACLTVRYEALKQIGSYDERMLLYYTEDDLCIRLRQQGWKLYYLTSAEVFHYAGRTARMMPIAKITYLYLRDIFQFVYKYWGLAVALLLVPLLCVHFITIIVRYWGKIGRAFAKKDE